MRGREEDRERLRMPRSGTPRGPVVVCWVRMKERGMEAESIAVPGLVCGRVAWRQVWLEDVCVCGGMVPHPPNAIG